MFLEAGGARAEADLVVADVAAALRDGVPAERIAVVTPRDPVGWPELAESLARAGIPHVMERSTTVARTAFGFALERLLTLRLGRRRRPAATCSRSCARPGRACPAAASTSSRAGCAAGRSNAAPAVEETVRELLGGGVWAVDAAADARRRPRAAIAETVRRMVVAAHGLEARGVAPADRLDLAAARAVLRVLDDVADAAAGARPRRAARPDRCAPASTSREDPTARVLVCDLRAARTLEADVVIVLGLEQGGISNRGGRRVPARRAA